MCAICERVGHTGAAAIVGGSPWGCSSVGRASAWHAEGRGIEAPQLHVPPDDAFSEVWRGVGYTLGGLVAGEGSFIVTRKPTPYRDGIPRPRFVFQVAMARRDRPLLVALRAFLGFGSITDAPAQREHWNPTSVFSIASIKAHLEATIPFSEHFLLPCAKRDQFELWRQRLADHEQRRPARRQRSICSVPGCEAFVRGRGLCRRHYYRVTGY